MTVQTVSDRVCAIVGVEPPMDISTDTTENGLRLKAMMQMAGDEIARRFDWRELITTASKGPGSQFDLPTDFERTIDGAAVRDAQTPFTVYKGSLSDSEWLMVQATTPAASRKYYRLSAGAKIDISIPLTGSNTLNFTYVSKNWLINGATTKSEIANKDDTARFPERLLEKNLIWRWRRQAGLGYQDELSEFEADLLSMSKTDRGSHLLSGGG